MSFSKKWYCLLLASFVLSSNVALAEDDLEKSSEAEETKDDDGNKSELTRIGHVNFEMQTQQALVADLRKGEAVWLDVEYPLPEGSTTQGTGKTQVLALQRPSQKPQRHGAILLIPDKGNHADWPEVIRPLRTELPESGWYTLSVSLPEEMSELVPERGLPVKQFDEVTLSPELRIALNSKMAKVENNKDAESTEEEGAQSESDTSENEEEKEDSNNKDTESVDIDLADKQSKKRVPYRDKALAHVQAGMVNLQQQGYQNIVLLAYRSSANIAMQYLLEKQGTFTEKGFALVLVDPLFNESFQVDLSEALGKNFRPPVLEIINSEEDADLVKARLASARVSGADRYMQVNYAFQVSEGAQKSLARRVRFWLERHAPGMIVGPRSR